MYAWAGRLLRVNLTTGSIEREHLSSRLAEKVLGARGLAAKFLYDTLPAGADPLGEENPLIFGVGPLTGTSAATSGRYVVSCKSPLTGLIACSNSGGHFGPELKFAGYDAVIVEGKASEPVYLWIDEDQVEIRPAGDIWGSHTQDTDPLIRAQTHPDAKVACIGPAGENLVKYACIMNDMHRAAGRSGVGAVMGSKKLKAVAVRGEKGIQVARPDEFRETVLECLELIKKNPVTGEGLGLYGTAILVNIVNEHGVLPTRNFQTSVFPAADRVGGETIAQKTLVRQRACFGCPINCGRVTAVVKGKYTGRGEGPEYESAWSMGPQCGIDNLEAVTKANYLCNELGMDSISFGSTLGCAMELYEKGYLTLEHTGAPLEFGDTDALLDLVEKTAYRRGFGNELAEGSHRLASKVGHPELSMSVKKQELPAYDPRGIQGIGLSYATSNRGGCHLRAYMISPEILGLPKLLDRFVTTDKATWVKIYQDLTAVIDSSCLCLFTAFALGAPEYLALLRSATGVDYTEESMMQVGERIWTLERMFNLREQVTRADDTLPRRLLEEPIPDGPAKGQVTRLGEMLDEYYQLRGWDDDGVPTQERLEALGIG